MSNIWLFPPEENLLELLVNKINNENKKTEEDIIKSIPFVFMPTRRSCRLLEQTFLNSSKNQSSLLPNIMPIGDPNIESFDPSLRSYIAQHVPFLDLESVLQQEIIATEVLQSLPLLKTASWQQCFLLAQDLLSFYEKITTQGFIPENISLENLLSQGTHNKYQIEFLKIFFEKWPEILKENNWIDRGSFRYTILQTLSTYWKENPPDVPIFSVLSAGWIPPVANLIKTLSMLPKAQILIHGAPVSEVSLTSLDSLTETSPFFYIKLLCDHLNIKPSSLSIYPNISKQEKRSVFLLPAFMPQTKTSSIKICTKKFLNHVKLHTCTSIEEEAQLIALSLREVLNTPKKTAALITPNRNLAIRVQAHLKKWQITIDDSAGISLKDTSFGQFCLKALDLLESKVNFFTILNVSNSPFVKENITLNNNIIKKHRKNLDTESLETILKENKKEDLWKDILDIRNQFLSPYTYSCDQWVERYLKYLKLIVKEDTWKTQEADLLLKALKVLSSIKKTLSKSQFYELKNVYISQQVFRPAWGSHPRLSILGLRESRLINVDKIILGGLNEGVWPSKPQQNMWQYNQIQKELKLPGDATKVGLDGFDFWLNINASSEILLTRSIKDEKGPTIPARWINYLQLYLEKYNLKLQNDQYLQKALDFCQNHHKYLDYYKRPTSIIKENERPKKISITQVEKFLKDPYLFYCQKVLNLYPLEEIESPLTPIDFGILVHSALEVYTKNFCSKNLNEESLLLTFKETFSLHSPGSFDNPFWHKRLSRLVKWLIPNLKSLSDNNNALFPEVWVDMALNNNLTIFGKIDRIDCRGNNFSVIDYKTGRLPSKKSVLEGSSPQLPLSALLAKQYLEKTYPNKENITFNHMAYWSLHHNLPEIIYFQETELLTALNNTLKILSSISKLWLEKNLIFQAPDICTDPLYYPLERQQEWKK